MFLPLASGASVGGSTRNGVEGEGGSEGSPDGEPRVVCFRASAAPSASLRSAPPLYVMVGV